MKKKLTILGACVAFLLLGATSISGQNGVLLPENQVTPRRATSPGSILTINHSQDVNNEFGAGESSRITPGEHDGQKVEVEEWFDNATPTPSILIIPGTINKPNTINGSYSENQLLPSYSGATPPAGSISDIQLGSEDSKNVVIRTYSGGGFTMGWISVIVSTKRTGPNASNYVTGHSGNNPIIDRIGSDPTLSWKDAIELMGNDGSINLGIRYSEEPFNLHENNDGDGHYNIFSFSKYNYRNFLIDGDEYLDDGTTPNPYYNPNPWDAWNFLPWEQGGHSQQAVAGRRKDGSITTDYIDHVSIPIPWWPSDAQQKNAYAICGRSLFETEWTPDGHGGGGVFVGHHAGFARVNVHPLAEPDNYIYTSSIDGTYEIQWPDSCFYESPNGATYDIKFPIDDNVPLIQINGNIMRNAQSLSGQVRMQSVEGTEDYQVDYNGAYLFTNGAWANSDKNNMANYRRPTTVLLEDGNHTFDKFTIKDINWYYESDTVSANITERKNIYECTSGPMAVLSITPEWQSKDPVAGATLVDGAIVLAPDAKVCVVNNVADATSEAATKTTATAANPLPNAKTDAVLVFPDDGRFTLRVGHDIDSINMTHDNTSRFQNDPKTNHFYTQGTFPLNADFAHSGDSVSSYKGTTPFTFAATPLDKDYNDIDAITIASPYSSTPASVIGVKHNYNYKANNADWYTNTPYDLDTNNPGVIEIGDTTKGTEHMHIYSGGMLKNYESSCTNPCNFTMYLGSPASMGGDDKSPEFVLNGTDPLYIANFGNGNDCGNCSAGLRLYDPAIESIKNALTNASADGALQIQARDSVRFMGFFDPTITTKKNELRILSDDGSVSFDLPFYLTVKDTNVVVWAKGASAGFRSCPSPCGGFVNFASYVEAFYSGKGILLIRSEYDDVLMDSLMYANTPTGTDNGELIIQAGQDIYAKTAIHLESAGQKSMLLEAKKTIHDKGELDIMKLSTATKDSVTFRAGYKEFSHSAVVSDWTPVDNYACTLKDLPNYYGSRDACKNVTEGGDIWLEGPAYINYTAPVDSITTILRAFNSIYLDDVFNFSRVASGDSVINGKSVGGQGQTMLFAETGNIEAIKGQGKDITFTLGKDSSLLTIQAGNMIGDKCAAPTQLSCWNRNGDGGAEYDGNILFNNKLVVKSEGTGNFLMSSARDIETQTSGEMKFDYANDGLNSGDILITAGRHVETHAPATFNYLTDKDTAKITIQAGRIDDDTYTCTDALCKVSEYGTSLTAEVQNGSDRDPYDPANVSSDGGYTIDNEFAKGGKGHGSILAFDSINFNYKGVDTILMTALNGNIETDPYLHGKGYKVGAPITFNHGGEGVTRMEAIDIKLHDKMEYIVSQSATPDLKNGQFYMAAYDSILTRNISYKNPTDTGSVFITTDKIKMIGGNKHCEESIYQGHIVLGYGADCTTGNLNDTILFDLDNNQSPVGANIGSVDNCWGQNL